MAGLRERIRARREARLGGGTGSTGSGGGQTGGITDPETPTRMPDPNDPVAVEERRRRLEEMRRRGGRLSTILSDDLRDRIGLG